MPSSLTVMLIYPAEHLSRKEGNSPARRTMPDILSHKNSDLGQSFLRGWAVVHSLQEVNDE
jgi:hypothetical protein